MRQQLSEKRASQTGAAGIASGVITPRFKTVDSACWLW